MKCETKAQALETLRVIAAATTGATAEALEAVSKYIEDHAPDMENNELFNVVILPAGSDCMLKTEEEKTA